MPTHSGNVDVRTPNYGLVQLNGTVTFGGSGAVASVDAVGFTVTKPVGTGVYTITTDDKWPSLKGLSFVLDTQGTPDDVQVQINGGLTSNNTISLLNVRDDAASDATSGDVLYITLWLKNTNVTP